MTPEELKTTLSRAAGESAPAGESASEIAGPPAPREGEASPSHLYPAEAAALAVLRSSEASELPPGATSVADVLAAFDAERERREREETIRAISRRAGRTSTKEAVADRKTTDPSAERSAQRATREARDVRIVARDAGREHDAEHEWQRSPSTSRREAPRAAERRVQPASTARASVASAAGTRSVGGMARHQIETYNSARGLAYYRVGGRLHEADDPAARAAELLAGDPDAIAVVHDQVQERRLRQALRAFVTPDPTTRHTISGPAASS